MSGVRSLLIALCVACGCASNSSIVVKTRVGVTIDPAPRELPFNPRGARLLSAHSQLEQIAGHPIDLVLDAAVSPESRSTFEDALIDAFESIAQDLNRLKKSEIEVFAFGMQRLNRVEIRYDGTLREDEEKLDEASRALVIRGPATRKYLIGGWVVYFTLMRAYDNAQTASFAHQNPDAISPANRYEYFRWLTNDRHIQRRNSAADKRPYTEAQRTSDVLRLIKLNQDKDANLEEKATNWLISQGDYFHRAYANNLKELMSLPANSIFNQAASEWANWAISVFPQLDDDDRLSVTRYLFIRSFDGDRAVTHRSYPPIAWPGVDLFAFGMSEVDRWRQSGHPNQLTKPRCSKTTEFVVCPRGYNSQSRSWVSANCEHDWYRHTLETQAGRKRLASAIIARKDPIFTQVVFENVSHALNNALDVMLVLLRELETDKPAWTLGWQLIAQDYVNAKFDIAALEESRRLWVTYPDRRGILLSGLVHMDRGRNGNVDWKGFAGAFGSQISSSEFADYLAVDEFALYDVSLAWPALGHGWSRAALIVPRIDSWRANEGKKGYAYQNSRDALQQIVGEMCRERDSKDLALMRNYFDGQRRAHPNESYSGLIEETRESACQPPPPPPPARNEVILSPLRAGLPPLRIIQTGAE